MLLLFRLPYLCVLLSLLLFAVGCGTAAPPQKGVFVQVGRSFTELTALTVEGVPQADTVPDNGRPAVRRAEPTLLVWRDETNPAYLVLYALESGDKIPFTRDITNSGAFALHPVNPLAPGAYCIVQANGENTPFTAWCFDIEAR